MRVLYWISKFNLIYLLVISFLITDYSFALIPKSTNGPQELHEFIFDDVKVWTDNEFVRHKVLGNPDLIISTVLNNGFVYLLLEVGNALNNASNSLMLNPIASAGNIIIKRNRDTGEFLQLKMFFRNHEGAFLRIFPDGNRSKMEIFLQHERLYSNVSLGVPFQRIITLPVDRLISMTSITVDWNLILYEEHTEGDQRISQLISQIQSELVNLFDNEDGAINSNGEYVFIESGKYQPLGERGLNCSGFCKWIIDGYYYPLKQGFTDIEILKRKNLESRGNVWSTWFESERDPFFGLDWARNLSLVLEKARTGKNDISLEHADVRKVDFSPYIEDVGFPISKIEIILFSLAARNPGSFYIGSINQEYGDQPILRQHSHLVIFFPYFNIEGNFKVVLVERNLENSFESLKGRYQGGYVHLTRIPAKGDFKKIHGNYF